MKKQMKHSRKRPAKQQQIIVLVDGAGNYYEIPRAKLERSRVSDRRKKKVSAALKAMGPRWHYIPATAVPGSIAPPEFVEAQRLRYTGFYVTSTKTKR